jgi:ATP-dependent Clp endopeptidase proteolytic subunit ClpP
MSKQKFIAIKNQADSNTLEVYFLDVIQDSFDWWTGMQYSKVQEIIDKVNYYKPSKIKCIIDSEGGDAQAGLSVYNFLVRVDCRVEVEVIGLAGSIASVIAMSANKGKLKMARNAFMMIHRAEGIVMGTADEIRQGAELVDKYTDQIVDVYSQRTGKTVDEIKALIANGDFWMTAEEAKNLGFCDEIFNEVNPNLQIAARLDTNVYKNIPAQIRAQLKGKDEPAEDSKTFIQNQFAEMKKFFTEIVNAIKGVKPEEGKTITNQIADAVTAPFEKLGDEMETTITNKVNEAVAGDAVNGSITTKVNNAVAAIDFVKEGPAKIALDAAVKVAVENATKDFATKITALETAKTELENKNTELEKDITSMKGNKTNSENGEEKNTYKPVGKWN